jgi:hypothetical protein
MDDILSPANRMIFLYLPVWMRPIADLSIRKQNPEQATSISKQKAFLIPLFSATIEAAEGKK